MPLPIFAPIDLVASTITAKPQIGVTSNGVDRSIVDVYIQNTLGAPAPNVRVRFRFDGLRVRPQLIGELDYTRSMVWAGPNGIAEALLRSTRSGAKSVKATVMYDLGQIGNATRPDAISAGYGALPLTPYVGPMTISVPTTIDQQEITGQLTIASDDVTITNCLLDAAGANFCVEAIGHTGVDIDRCELRGATRALISGFGWNLFRSHLHDCLGHGAEVANTNPAFGSGLLSDFRSCFIEDIGKSGVPAVSGASSGIHAQPGGLISTGGTRIVVSPLNRAAVSVQSVGTGRPDRVVLESCWFDGGQTTLRLATGSGAGPPTGCLVQNNRFGDTGGALALIDVDQAAPDSIFRGNHHDNTFRPITDPEELNREGLDFKYSVPTLELELVDGVVFEQPQFRVTEHVATPISEDEHVSGG